MYNQMAVKPLYSAGNYEENRIPTKFSQAGFKALCELFMTCKNFHPDVRIHWGGGGGGHMCYAHV